MDSDLTRSDEHERDVGIVDMRPARLGLDGPSTRERRQRDRLRRASWAFTTRRVPTGVAVSLIPPPAVPRSGDLVLARIDALGHHGSLHLANGRRRHLFPGDEIVVAYGNRYASSQFESHVPETLGPCHLVAGGGIASRAISWHVKISRGPTPITPIGLLADSSGKPLNLRQFALTPSVGIRTHVPTVLAVVGTSMDSGKTQTAVHLTRGLTAAGLQVGYAKVTGTGAGGDYWWLRDAGADPVLDFTDMGIPSTYRESNEEILRITKALVSHIASHGVDAIVLEIADGVLQRETAALLESAEFPKIVGGILLAAQDSMGASAGYEWLRQRGTPVLALSGVLTAAPLQVEEALAATGLSIYDREALALAQNAIDILGQAQAKMEVRDSDGFGAA